MNRLCTVRGTLVGPDGKPLRGNVRFLANRTGKPVTGALMIPAPVSILLDGGGSFTVQLTPSAVVGPYTLRTPAGTYTIEVPDAPAAKLLDIIVWSRG